MQAYKKVHQGIYNSKMKQTEKDLNIQQKITVAFWTMVCFYNMESYEAI